MDVAETRLISSLSGPHYLGPVFAASSLCGADADLISNGLLLDFKTRIGKKNARGERYDALSLEDLYQLLAYALFDRTNEYSLKRIGIYSARFGSLTTWDLSQALKTLANGPVSLDAERTQKSGICCLHKQKTSFRDSPKVRFTMAGSFLGPMKWDTPP